MSAQLLTSACVIAALYGLYNFSIKVGSDGIHQIVAAVVLQVVATIIGSAALLFLYLRGTTFPPVTGKGLGFAIMAGAAVGLAEILSFYVYSRGLPVSIGTPLIVGGTVVVGSLLGIAFLHEVLKPSQCIGFVLMAIAIALLTSK